MYSCNNAYSFITEAFDDFVDFWAGFLDRLMPLPTVASLSISAGLTNVAWDARGHPGYFHPTRRTK